MSMYQKVLQFIKYNNAFTIVFVILFFGFGIGFAASPELREGVYSSAEIVVSIDNSLIVSADLDNFNFKLRIRSITEDEKNYYVIYSYQTLTIEDGFWQNKEVERTLTVSKEVLAGRDLGLYVAEELGENINYELSYLRKVQKLQKEKGESQKVVTVEYSGLVGKLLNPKEKVIEGYSPVIPEVVPAAVVISTPEKIVDEELVQEVIEELLPDQPVFQPEPEPIIPASDLPAGEPEIIPEEPATEEATSTPEIIPEESVTEEATSTPEIIPEESVTEEATSTPDLPADEAGIIPEPEPEPEPEIMPEPEPEPEIIPEPEPEPVSEPTQ